MEDSTAPLPGLADGGPTPSSGEAELDLAARVRLASLRGAMFGAAAEPPRIGRFVLQEALGAGGMGIVYAAHDPDLERRVALKLVRPDAAAAASSQARLLREAKSMARLSHPNVVQIHEVGVWEGRVFIAMELVPGRTLAAWLAAPGRSWREIVAVFVAAGRGLAAAHEVGVVHRDFKPENVLVGEDGRARVTDFGLARGELGDVTPGDRPASDALADLAGAAVTASGAVMGTPAYMAPELFVGGPATAASDQFSFCVALYHALHGVRPFAGADRAELVRSVIAARREEPARLRIPRAIHRALVRGLAPAPADRFKNMHALLAAIEAPRAWRGVVAGGVVAGVVAGLLAVLRPWEPACEASRSRFETGNSENEYIVPRGCTTIQVQAWGGGGGGAIDPGGGGGYTGATLRVTPGQTLVVAVGNAGTSWAEAWATRSPAARAAATVVMPARARADIVAFVRASNGCSSPGAAAGPEHMVAAVVAVAHAARTGSAAAPGAKGARRRRPARAATRATGHRRATAARACAAAPAGPSPTRAVATRTTAAAAEPAAAGTWPVVAVAVMVRGSAMEGFAAAAVVAADLSRPGGRCRIPSSYGQPGASKSSAPTGPMAQARAGPDGGQRVRRARADRGW